MVVRVLTLLKIRIAARAGHFGLIWARVRGQLALGVQRVRNAALELDVRAQDVLAAVALFRLEEL